MNEETKSQWIKIGVVALVTFLASFCAFNLSIKHNLKKMTNPFAEFEKMESFIAKQEREFNRINEKMLNNPFEPKMRPMIVNLVKEANEYRVIVDLAQFDGDENLISIDTNDNELTVKGQLDKNVRGTEKIIRFTQSYSLDEKINKENIKKEKKDNKYIITIPFED